MSKVGMRRHIMTKEEQEEVERISPRSNICIDLDDCKITPYSCGYILTVKKIKRDGSISDKWNPEETFYDNLSNALKRALEWKKRHNHLTQLTLSLQNYIQILQSTYDHARNPVEQTLQNFR